MYKSNTASRLMAIAAFAGSVLALGLPPDARLQVRHTDAKNNAGMIWTGVVFPGQEAVTLEGDIESILEQIFKLNPEYVAEDIAVTEARINGITPATERRDQEEGSPLQARAASCRVMGLGLQWRLQNDGRRLQTMGGSCGAPARDCRRMTCTEDSAAYICSESDAPADIPCVRAGELVHDISIDCRCGANASGFIYDRGHPRPFSIWAGYGFCWTSGNVRPTEFKYPGGHGSGYC